MIKPGQKLSEGDYFRGGTLEQYEELLEIEAFPRDDYAKYCLSDNGIVVVTGWIFDVELVGLNDGNTNPVTQYAFPEFKALCENTFNNKTET